MSSANQPTTTQPAASSSFGWQLFRQRPLADPTTSFFTGKTILITGANSGLGLAAAAKFVSLRPARLILAVRNLEAGRAAKQAIEQQLQHQHQHHVGDATVAAVDDTNTRGVDIDVWHLDMASYPSITSLTQKVNSELPRLDVAVLNAGVYEVAHGVSAYGWERTLQVNTLSTALLGISLLPKLRATSRQWGKGGPSVLQVVASRRAEAVLITERMRAGKVLEAVKAVGDGKGRYNASEQYRVSKFLLMAVVKKLATLVGANEVAVTAVCPGGVSTNLSRGWTGMVATAVKALVNSLMLRTPEYAARSVVSGAALGSEASGKLWYDDELHE